MGRTLCLGLLALVSAAAALGVAGCGGDDSGGGGPVPTPMPEAGAPDGAGMAPDSDSGAPIEPAPPTSTLVDAEPADGSSGVPRTEWFRLEFSETVERAAAQGIALDCGDSTPETDADVVGGTLVVINPRAALPPGADCTLSWTGPDGPESVSFSVAGEGAPAVVRFDRNDRTLLAPFPDDFFLETDSSTPTGLRVALPVPEVPPALTGLLSSVVASANGLDGFSPLAPIVIALPDAVDPTTVPQKPDESLDPFSTVALFDLDEQSETYLERVPFYALLRDEANADGTMAHNLVVIPAVPLSDRGRYAMVVTGRVLVDATRPLESSEFFRTAVDPSSRSTEAEQIEGALLTEIFDALGAASPPIRPDDAALAIGFTIRSDDEIAADLLSIRDQVASSTPPTFVVDSVDPETEPGSDVAVFVRGSWQAPDWSSDGNFIDRDASGAPTTAGTTDVPFVLALPNAALSGPVPLMIYQHGQPGNVEDELPRHARRDIAPLGAALIGFTDVANREIIPNGDVVALNTAALTTLLGSQALPDYLSLLSLADQLAFVRMLSQMGSIDVLPEGAPDGEPDIDPSLPLTYLGISQGATHGIGLVAYAPEIEAAALVAGAGGFTRLIVHQTSELLYQGVTGFFPDLDRTMFYTGLAIAQMGYDSQDTLNHARYVYREPHDLGAASRPSVLLVEGINDSLIPPYNTRAGAWALGIPHVEPVREPEPFLEVATAPLQGNIDASTTAGFFQYVPTDVDGIAATPGCTALSQPDGHYCAQSAGEARAQRAEFFRTALSGVPAIIDPF